MSAAFPPMQAHPDFAAVRALLAAVGLPTADSTSATSRGRVLRVGVAEDRVEACAWLLLAAEQGERDARDLAPGVQAELNDAEREQARDRALRYRQGAR